MIFNRKNKIKIGRKYELNGVECEVLAKNNNGSILLIEENDGNLAFILGDIQIKQDKILATEVIGFSISHTEMRDYLNDHCVENVQPNPSDIAKIVRKRYYKIPTSLAEVIGVWYTSTQQ